MMKKPIKKTAREVPLYIGEGAEGILRKGIKVRGPKLQRTLTGYAAPSTWGPDVTVASHIGSISFTISYEAVGDTLVKGRVTYWKGEGGGSQVKEEFFDETTIRTSNSVANVLCDFQGIPLGSAVNIYVDP
jgi:hypothetical protein